jgi:hypothetical protein
MAAADLVGSSIKVAPAFKLRRVELCSGRVAMTRQQREAELRLMLTTQRGKEEPLAILKHQAGISEGNLPPFGTLLVDTILNYEYPPEGGAGGVGGGSWFASGPRVDRARRPQVRGAPGSGIAGR